MEVVERKAKGRRAADISCPAVSSRHTSQHPTRPDRVDLCFVGADSIKVKLNSFETLPLCKYIFDTKWMMCFRCVLVEQKGRRERYLGSGCSLIKNFDHPHPP